MPLFHRVRPRRVVLALVVAGLAVAAATAGVPALAAPAVPEALAGDLTEDAASALVPAVRDAAGPALAGIWFVPSDTATPARGRLMVGTWEPALAPALTALGATPVVRDGPRRDPAAALRELTARTASGMPDRIADFGVDEVTQTLVVTIVGEDAGAPTLLDGLDPSTVRVVTTRSAPRRQAAIGGGDTLTDGTRRCTAGFTATDGAADWLVTAGHCTRGSSTWSGPGDVTLGGDTRTADTGPDAGAIRVEGGWTAVPTAGGEPVRGMRVAPVGTTVCLSGSTSGRICGPVARQDVVVNFDGQQQAGLTATDLCAQTGDSGGPYAAPDGQAQGIHTGAGGPGCTSYFTPVGSAMGALGLTLRTG